MIINKRLIFCSYLLGVIYSFVFNTAKQLNAYNTVNLRALIIPSISMGILVGAIIGVVFLLLAKFETSVNPNRSHKVMDFLCSHPYLLTIILFICWLPCFLSDFPGGFRHDVYQELLQAELSLYSPAFPMLHTVIFTRFLPFMNSVFGSYNVGIATYVVIQMILIALLYTHIIRVFYKKGISAAVLWIVLLYMALFPTIHMLVEFSGRDMLFTGLLVYTIFSIYEMITDKSEFWSSFKRPIALAIALPLTVYSRNNSSGLGFLIAFVTVVALIVIFNFKGNISKVATFGVSSIAIYILLGMFLTSMCQPTFSNNKTERESLGFYAQTLARAYIYDNPEWTEEELDELTKYCDANILATYNPLLSDLARASIYVNSETRDDFMAFWWKIGKKHAGTYLDAYLINSQPAWDINAILYGYVKGRPEGYYGKEKQYFSFNPESEEPPAVHVDLLPAVNKFYQHIAHDISFEKIPVIKWLFAIGFHLWFALFAFVYLIYRKAYKLALPVGIVFLYGAVCTFVPIVLVRYFALLFFATPILFVFVMEPKKSNE